MKQKGKLFLLGAVTMLTAVAFATSTFAWFAYIPALDFGTGSGKINVGAGSETSYYESGSGDSIDDPYIISNRNHLYNLAWLQYMGMYNSPSIRQKYFKLKNDIDMTGITLPPIGTDNYPFLGHFDGNGKTVSNLVVSNDDPLQSSSDFGVTKPTSNNLQNTEQSEIVGFFGVVGQSPVIDDLTYTSSIVSISDLTLNNITVRSKTDQTLIGLAAGYVDGTMSGVRVDGDATIDVDGQSTTAAIDSITDNISDYGLVGYSTKTSRSGSYSQDISAYYDSEDDEGQGANWGGSIAIDDIFDRLTSIKSTYMVSNTNLTTEKTITYKENNIYVSEEVTNTASGTTVYEYNENANKGTYNNKLGAFQVSNGNSSNFHYLSAGHYTKKVNQVKHQGRPITDGTNYLSLRVNDSNTCLFTNATSEDTCTFWSIPVGSTGKISSLEQYAGSTQYLTMVNNVLELTDSSSSAINWTVSTNNGILSIYSGNWHLMYDGDWIVRDFSKTSETWYDIAYINGNTTYYFMPGGTETTNPYYLRSTTSQDERIHWSYDTTYHGYYYMRGGASRYLMYNPTYPVIANNSKSSSSPFYRLGGSTSTVTGSDVLTARYSSTNYTINSRNNNDNGWGVRTGTSGYTFTITAVTININTTDNILDRTSYYYGPDTTSMGGYMDYSEQDVTYFPLNVKDDYTPADNNTGYMVGGSSYTSSDSSYGYGTLRLSNYYSLSESINNFNRSTYKLSNVRTYNASGKAIIDDNNNTYQKYAASKEKVENMLKKHSSANKVYGLHFMDNLVSKDYLVTARYAQINTSTYTNYQLPASSIDFNLKERGFVNFFAGTYGKISGTDTTVDSFFSIHLIQRDSNNAITNIYEIEQILSDGNQDHAYIYKLSNGSYTIPYSYNIYNQKVKYVVDTKTPLGNVYPEEDFTMVNSYPNTYSVIFDTSWVKYHNNLDQHYMYYFEIPINCGEFCLGSVENSNFGAYLVYLDIGAFSRDDDAVHAYCVTTHVNSLAYPDGVDFAAAGATAVAGGETFCVLLPTNITGSISFAVTETVITISDSDELSTYSYKGSKYSDSPVQGGFTVAGDSPGALVAPPAGGERLMHIQIDAADGSRWDIDILDALDENGTVLSTSYPMIKQDGENRTVNDIPTVLNEVLDDKIRTLTSIVTLTRNTGTTQFVTTATYDEQTRKVVSLAISNEDLTNTSVEVGGIANGYTISINGTPVSNGTIYPN